MCNPQPPCDTPMSQSASEQPVVIGLTGPFGSGCSYIADRILTKKGYTKISLSGILKELFKQKEGRDPVTENVKRRDLQEFGDQIRKDKGNGYLAQKAFEHIEAARKAGDRSHWVVDSIRNPWEIRVLRQFNRFYLFGIYADKKVRWNRVGTKWYDGDQKQFDDDDENDTGYSNPEHGQHVGSCFYEADIVMSNNDHVDVVDNDDFKRIQSRVLNYVELVENPLSRMQPLNQMESLMVMAYAVSQRSSCLKRKVGAVVVDADHSVISSGYNEVPVTESPCKAKYVNCYRDHLCDHFFVDLRDRSLVSEHNESKFKDLFRSRFKILDYCRAIHAEEQALLNLAKNGRATPLNQCTLYTTTYPCRLCAQKIVYLNLERVVYLEPYPQPEAKAILKNGNVEDEFFQGVTYRAYFRLYGEQK
jgi:deoxycytidylate deaminase/dephospho-CoA kinase